MAAPTWQAHHTIADVVVNLGRCCCGHLGALGCVLVVVDMPACWEAFLSPCYTILPFQVKVRHGPAEVVLGFFFIPWQVEVVAEVDGWMHCVSSFGSRGLVPASYLQLLPGRADSSYSEPQSARASVRAPFSTDAHRRVHPAHGRRCSVLPCCPTQLLPASCLCVFICSQCPATCLG